MGGGLEDQYAYGVYQMGGYVAVGLKPLWIKPAQHSVPITICATLVKLPFVVTD